MKPSFTLKFLSILLISVFLSTAVAPAEAAAPHSNQPGVQPLPALEEFVSAVANGQPNVVRGVHVPDVLALRIVQQPADNPGFVSRKANAVTQFGLAAKSDVTGLLAHNHLAGRLFFNLTIGHEVHIIYGDGAVKTYVIAAVYEYQALQPANPKGDLVDLSTGAQVSVVDVFVAMYMGGDHVTFQTCISRDGNASWGRLFVVAYPA